MELLSWVKFEKLSHVMLCANTNIGEFIKNTDHIITKDWIILSGNPSALPLLLQNRDEININLLCSNTNPAALPLIKSEIGSNTSILHQSNPITFDLINMNILNIVSLCANTHPSAIAILQTIINDGQYDLNWEILSANPAAISILEQNQDKIKWANLSSNPAAMHLILQNPHKINYCQLCKNTHVAAIELIAQRSPDSIYWPYLSSNPTAIDFLEKNQEHINWYYLSLNPAIFRYNYEKMAKIRNEHMYEELMAVSLHPSRISYWLKEGVLLSEI
jgi:hypothetical protein